MANAYLYHLPGNSKIFHGVSDDLLTFDESVNMQGFAIASFNDPEKLFIIPSVPREIESFEIQNLSHYFDTITMPKDSIREDFEEKDMTELQHRRYIEDIKRLLNTTGGGKVVAARTLTVLKTVDAVRTFKTLTKVYNDAFVFLIHTDRFGTWIGASPELLLKRNGIQWHTMSLAGTRPIDTPGPWDQKNMEEQQIVTDFISDALYKNGLNVNTGSLTTKGAGPIEHLMTPIAAKGCPDSIIGLLNSLSPTPALSGFPRNNAVELINRTEPVARHLYGGYLGPFINKEKFSLYVNLRSAQIFMHAIRLYAGGGVTLMSDPKTEWNETKKKLSTLLPYLSFI